VKRGYFANDPLRGTGPFIIADALLLFSFAAQNKSHVCLELLSQKFKKAITNKRGCESNSKIGSRENIS